MKYTRHLHFQNRYITKDFIALNKLRKRQGLETVLPLTYPETKLYSKVDTYKDIDIYLRLQNIISNKLNFFFIYM